MTTLTVCPYCGVGCSLYVTENEGNGFSVVPSRSSPVNNGTLCIKGWKGLEFVENYNRLKVPLIKKDNEFVEATWSEAISLIARKLKEYQDRYGVDSIAFQASAKCTNEENFLMQKLARVAFQTNNIDHCARSCHASTVEGLISAFGSGAMTCSIEDIEKAELLFVIGSNTTEQHPIIGAKIINAVKNGAKLIVADPIKIQLANLANVYIQHRPGSDVALLNTLANLVLKYGKEDREFIQSRTEGFSEFENTVRKYDLETTAGVIGADLSSIEKAAELYANSSKTIIFYAMGITQHTQGTENVQAIANLAMLKGNVGKEGAGVAPLRGHNNVQGSCDVGALPDFLPGYKRVWDNEARYKFEAYWNCKISPKPGLILTDMFDAAIEGKLKALYIMGENPVLSEPNISHITEALEKLDFLVVQDIFMTETAKYADLVLPAASFAEKSGTFTSTDRRIQKVRKVLNPKYQIKEDWQILLMLAHELGVDWKYESPEDIMREISELVPIYEGVTEERLNVNHGLQWPVKKDGTDTKMLHKDKFARGLAKFHAVEWKMPAEKVDKSYPFILTTGRSYYQWHTGTMSRKVKILEREAPAPYLEINSEDAKALNIVNNSMIYVTSKYGKLKVRAKVTDRVLKGVVYMPFHYYEAAANTLTNANLDPIAKIPDYKVTAVRIEVF